MPSTPLVSTAHHRHRLSVLHNSGVQLVCKLTKLQRLALHSLKGVTAAGLAGLRKLRKLRCLSLDGLTCDISLSAVPAFSQLTHLKYLRLVGNGFDLLTAFDPAVLGCMTKLQALYLREVSPNRGAAGAAELLSRLEQLPKLEKLDLMYVRSLDHCPPAAFSSLTSSSVLKSLCWGSLFP